MRRIVEVCDKSGKKYRTLPAIGELIDGSVSLKAIREVTLGDLLGREEVLLDRKEIGNYLQNKRILVTGGGVHRFGIGLPNFKILSPFHGPAGDELIQPVPD